MKVLTYCVENENLREKLRKIIVKINKGIIIKNILYIVSYLLIFLLILKSNPKNLFLFPFKTTKKFNPINT